MYEEKELEYDPDYEMYQIQEPESEKQIKILLTPQFNFVNSLSDDVKHNLTTYTTPEVYQNLNEKMRNSFGTYNNLDLKLSFEEQNILDSIDYAFENVPKLIQPLTLYRGVANLYPRYSLRKTPTNYFDTKRMISIISATYDKNIAKSFASSKNKCCFLVLTIPAGSSVLPLQFISDVPSEKEILLNRKGMYYITSQGMEEHDFRPFSQSLYTYHITYIPKDSVIV
jgi:hypothetical protein